MPGRANLALARINAHRSASERARLIEALVEHVEAVDWKVHRAATLALGLLGGERAYAILITLLRDDASGRYLADRTYRDRERAFAAYAIGVLGAGSADEFDPDLQLALRSIVSQDLDEATVSFALMSIGQFAGRSWAGLRQPSHPGPPVDFLLETVRDGTPSRAAWAALALGVHGHGLRQRGLSVDARLGDELCTRFLLVDEPRHRGAFAIGLALIGDHASGGWIHEVLRVTPARHRDHLRGELCQALALLGEDAPPGAKETILRTHAEAENRVHLSRLTAEALGLFPTSVSSQPLLRTIRRQPTFVGGPAALTLGVSLDRTAAVVLIDVARRGGPYPNGGRRRASACIALGVAFGGERAPFNAPFARHANYLASPTTFVTHDRGHRFGLVDFH